MEAINIFLKKEIEDKMFERNVNGINYWEFIRPLVSCESNTIFSQTSKMFAKNQFCLKKYFPNLKNIKKYFLRNRTADILVISQPRRVKYEDKYMNNYIDFYVDYLKENYSVLTLEEPTWSSLGVSNKAHDFPLYTKNIYLSDFHELFLKFKMFLYPVFNRKNYKNFINEYEKVEEIVNSWYGTDKIHFKKFFLESLIRLSIDQNYIDRIIKKIKPKIVMLHYMPSIFKQMLIEKCNSLGIKTIEIQHGTITKIDPLVNKCLDISKLKHDNQYIFSFGPNQVHKYALAIHDVNKVVDVGFPFFENKIKKLPKMKKKYILVISQSTIGDEMAKFTSNLAELVKDDNFKIVFKYHPNEFSKDYECLKKSNIIEIKNEMSIYDIQNQSILQIGSYSTSLYEGFAMKIPTLIIKSMFGSIEAVDIFSGIKKGVYFIEKENDVLKYINKNDIIPLDKDINKLWTKNSKNNLLSVIKKIMKEVEE